MTILSLSLSNFRNHREKNLQFSSGITVVIGKNTSGKTNLIEALYYLCVGKSFRMGKEQQIISFDENLSRIKGKVSSNNNDDKNLEIVITSGEVMGVATPKKRLLVNEVPRRSIDFVGILKSVLFWPEDMELITDSPSLRRRYLDFVLMHEQKIYPGDFLLFLYLYSTQLSQGHIQTQLKYLKTQQQNQ